MMNDKNAKYKTRWGELIFIGCLIKAFVYAVEPESALTREAENVNNYITWSLADVEEKSFEIYSIEVNFKNNRGLFELDMRVKE